MLRLCWLQPTASTAARLAMQHPQWHECLKDVFVCRQPAQSLCC